MKFRRPALITIALFLALSAPTLAFAAFNDTDVQAQQQVASLSQQQLNSLNSRVFSDAFIAAKIVGYDRSEIDQLKADVQELKRENVQLRASLGTQGAVQPPSNLEARVSALEASFSKLQSTLGKW